MPDFGALKATRRFPRCLNRRHQERDQNADDRNHGEQFDKRARATP